MSLKTEVLADRRLLQRRLSFWRVATFAIVAVMLIVFIAFSNTQFLSQTNQIARVTISGVITDDKKQTELLKKLAKTDHVKAVILHIDSPGGTTTGGEALYEAIQEVSEKKPITSVFGTVATSAAYIAGLGTDHIVSRGNTITGSVGVIFQWTEVSQLLNNLGIKMEEVKSGDLKANPSPFTPTDEKGRALAQEMVLDAHQWFVGLVKDRRKLDPYSVPGLTDGRIFSGRQALKLKLIDEIGGEDKAVAWLTEKRGVPKDLEVVDWKPQSLNDLSLLGSLAIELAQYIGFPVEFIRNFFYNSTTINKVHLDGLISIWKP